MEFTLLRTITNESKNIRMKLLIARGWVFINPRNAAHIFSYDLLLVDEEGKTIQAIMSNDVVEKFRTNLLEEIVYHISGFSVIPVLSTYRISIHDFRLRLPYNMHVKTITEGIHDILYDGFNFLTFEEVGFGEKKNALMQEEISLLTPEKLRCFSLLEWIFTAC